MKAAIYTRVSQDADGEGLAVDRQLRDCQELAEAKGWTVVAEYEDNDISASTISKKERPEYQAMMAAAKEGHYDVLIAYSNSRLTRRPAEWIDLIALANSGKVQIATKVSGQYDLTTADGRAVAMTVAVWDAAEAERVGERVSRAARQRAENGIPQKGRYRLFGYNRDWSVNEDEQKHIVEAFERRAAGESTTAIAKDFTTRGILTVAGREWKSGTLGVTLTKPIYCGLREYKGEIIGKSAVDALVDKPLFDAAQKNLANDKKGTNARKYLLSGLLMCSHCASPFKGNPANKMYRCSTTYGGCGRLSVRIELADQYVFHAAMSRYAREVGNAKVGGSPRDFKSDIEAVMAEISRLQEGFQAGVYTPQEVTPLIKEKRAVLRDLEKQAAQARPSIPKIQRQYLDWYRLNLSQKRAFIGDYITDVVVYPAVSKGNQPFDPSRLEVHYPDGTKERLERYVDYDPAYDD